MIARCCLLLALIASAGCGDIPKDQARTLDRVRAEGRLKVGLAGADGRPPTAPEQSLLTRVASRTGARAEIEHGSLERLLTELEEGELDLVLGEVEKKSPWSKRVTLVKPALATTQAKPAPELQLTAIARNGENGWIELLHHEARAVAGSGR